jgi:hypothetical protein
LGYGNRKPQRPYLVVRKQGHLPTFVVHGTRSKTKTTAQNRADRLNSDFSDRKDISFEVRQEGWRDKRSWS